MLCHAVLIEPRFNDSCSVGKDGKGDVHAIGYDPEGIVLLGKVSEPFFGVRFIQIFKTQKKRRNVHVGVKKTLDHTPTRRVVVKFTLGASIILPLGLIFIVRTVRKK